jgi:hypothetical protein
MLKHTLVLASLVTSLSLATTAHADTTCSPDIDVTYVGGEGTSVKVIAIQYKLDGTSKFHREDVKNTVLTKNKHETFKSQRLAAVAKGQKIELQAIYLKDVGKGFGNDEKLGKLRNSGKACENNVKYNLDIE